MNMDKDVSWVKRGYLKEDFKFFHLNDQKSNQFEFHYHDFNKIIIFISGNVTYLIEGKAYKLKPWDILFVSSNEIHKPLIDPDYPYERIIIWVNSNFLERHNTKECNLLSCFEKALKQKFNLLRLNTELLRNIKYTLFALEDEYKSIEFGSHVLKNSLFVQLIVYLNRIFLGAENTKEVTDIEYDENIQSILDYINANLGEDLSIENLASRLFMSKYYLMHKFKKDTGYTIHNYILQKRLIMAKAFIKEGRQITDVCTKCGFGDYSNFVRLFKKTFGISPRKYYKAFTELEKSYTKDEE